MTINISQVHLFKTLTSLTFWRLLRRRSTYVLLALGLLPCLVVLLWISSTVLSKPLPFTPHYVYEHILSIYFLTFYVPVLSIFLGLGVVSDEVETKNITFSLVRPLSRATFVLGRLAGHALAAFTLLGFSLVALYFCNMIFQVDMLLEQILHLGNHLFVIGFGLFAYISVIASLGTIWRKFALLSSVLWLVLDTVFSLINVSLLKKISIKYQMLSSFWEELPTNLPSFAPIETSASFKIMYCLIFVTAACALMVSRLKYMEVVLSNPEK